MSRTTFRGPKLPKELLDKVGAGDHGRKRGDLSRKDRRKAEREQKKLGNRSRPRSSDQKVVTRGAPKTIPSSAVSVRSSSAKTVPSKSILKKLPPVQPVREPSTASGEDDSPESNDAWDGLQSGSDSDSEPNIPSSPRISQRAAKSKLADDDAEIAALEKRLGIKGGKKSRSGDEFDDILDGLGEESDDESDTNMRKRKRPEDVKWLRDKRKKATHNTAAITEEDDSDGESESEIEGKELNADEELESDRDGGMLSNEPGLELDDKDEDEDASEVEDVENPFSDDEISEGDFDSDSDSPATAKPPRENPYVAPTSASTSSAGKYIPPSLRKASASEEETLRLLRRQIQGQINRLSEANILSIVQAMEGIYQKNARQHVTSSMIDLLIGMVADPAILNDTFLILHAAFSAALFKVAGTDFAAQLLEKIVENVDSCRTRDADGKQVLNLMAFLSNLYIFQVIGSKIIFEYIHSYLETLSEDDTELLLRMVRICGLRLRQEDPLALKDAVLLLQRNVSERGEDNLSVRTKFMVETINNLKNNRMKAGTSVSALAAEHTNRLKKSIGTLNSRAKSSTEPLTLGLSDIRDRDKKGKWWLVGASYHDPSKLANNDSFDRPSTTKITSSMAKTAGDDSLDIDGAGEVSLSQLARSQGMNTEIRQAIYVSIMAAVDFKDAQLRLLKLRLKAKQEQEIAPVLLHCATAEKNYNLYYAILARHLCKNRRLAKTFRFALWDTIGQLSDGDSDPDSDEEAEQGSGAGDDNVNSSRMKKTTHLAQFWAYVLSDGEIELAALKGLDLSSPSSSVQDFAQVFFTTLLLTLHKRNAETFGDAVAGIFSRLGSVPEMIRSLRIYLETNIAKARLAFGKKEARIVKKGCKAAIEGLVRASESAAARDVSVDEDDSE